jgi:SAM-dependent methyltransferase
MLIGCETQGAFTMPIHDKAKGYHHGAEEYVAGRPDYPAEAVTWLTDVLGVRSGRKVLEVGAGTGKFIPTLQQANAEILAVEPIAEMRDALMAAFPRVVALAGAADAIPLASGSVNVIVCAQAFHWFATRDAVAEMRRVLAPDGMLGLIWNGRDERVPWVAALSKITDRYEGNTPRYRTGAWRRVFPAPGFTLVDERYVRHVHTGTAEQVVLERTMSVSFIAGLAAKERAKVERDVRNLIAVAPELASGRAVAFPYVTGMYAYRAM